MKTLITVIIGGFILCITSAFAGMSQNATIKGRIIKFDKETVTLSQKGGRRAVVSRKSIPKYFKIRTGNDVFAVVSSDRILAAIKKEAKSKRSKDSKLNKKSKSQDRTP